MATRVLVMVDVSNLYYTINTKFSGRRLDYKKFLDLVSIGAGTIRAIAYGCEFADEPESAFKRVLQKIGFETRFKITKTYSRSDGSVTHKADWDVGIAVDTISLMDEFDVLILASADGDMSPLIRYLEGKGKICKVIGCRISRELRDAADSWSEITEGLLECQQQPSIV